jgi:thiol-disulfide isomerase/thioredoxin
VTQAVGLSFLAFLTVENALYTVSTMEARESTWPDQRIAKAFFLGLAFCTVVGYGTMLVIQAIHSNTPEVAALDALERTNQFARIGEPWRPEWVWSDLEVAPWKARSAKADVNSVDMTKGTVLVNLWATWCEPCKAEFPSMVELARDEPNLTIVFVSYDQTWDAQKKFLTNMFRTIPPGVVLLRDPKGQGKGKQSVDTLWHRLGATAVPETFIVRDGQILAKAIGGLNWKHPDIRNYLGLVMKRHDGVACSMTDRPGSGHFVLLLGLMGLAVFHRFVRLFQSA